MRKKAADAWREQLENASKRFDEALDSAAAYAADMSKRYEEEGCVQIRGPIAQWLSDADRAAIEAARARLLLRYPAPQICCYLNELERDGSEPPESALEDLALLSRFLQAERLGEIEGKRLLYGDDAARGAAQRVNLAQGQQKGRLAQSEKAGARRAIIERAIADYFNNPASALWTNERIARELNRVGQCGVTPKYTLSTLEQIVKKIAARHRSKSRR